MWPETTSNPPPDPYKFGFLSQSIKPIFMVFTKNFSVDMSDLYLAYFNAWKRFIFALLWMQNWVNYHQHKFSSNCVCLKYAPKKPPWATLSEFKPTPPTQSRWTKLPSCFPQIISLQNVTLTEAPANSLSMTMEAIDTNKESSTVAINGLRTLRVMWNI